MIQRARGQPIGPSFVSLAVSAALLAVGFCPLPDGALRSVLESARSPEMNRAEREANAGGYYEGLIGEAGGRQGARGELALRLLGKPSEWSHFSEAQVTRPLPGDLLQFELLPNQKAMLFGQPFTTNADCMRDKPYPLAKPAGVFRVAILGSSMDMGWGVSTTETYENRLEYWLNSHALQRHIPRQFELLNFSMAAYGPVQRLASFERKAVAYHPDAVFYSATMLDLRLLEIHVCDLLRGRVDLGFDFLKKAVAEARLTTDDLALDATGQLTHKDVIKAKLRPHYWEIVDGALTLLAADCDSAGISLYCLIIPRVGKADAPEERAAAVAQHKAIAKRHGIPVFDLSGTFDHRDPATIEIAAWDDHPNALGHTLLFRSLAQAIVSNPATYETMFGAALPDARELARIEKQYAGHPK
ncbi:MAG TPA: SGNH/GDSL hydrolase family protein [Isosphaeraceae bacterium]|jgi:hypothetical protein|nr:SGNH/GDSL hydrolase family protein [Isosphaeraceae bacterium]